MAHDNQTLSGRVCGIDGGYSKRRPAANTIINHHQSRVNELAHRTVKNVNTEWINRSIGWRKIVFSNIVIDREDEMAVPDRGFEDRTVSTMTTGLPPKGDRYPNVHQKPGSQSW